MQGGTVKPEAAAIPLVVDLDGTLVRSDTLHEALLAYLAAAPVTGLRNCIGWLPGGKAAFKAELAARRIASPASLQYDQRVLDRIAEARAAGRQIYLVSASHQAQVSAISEHLGLFDDAVGSDPSRNLGGAAKATYLCERFGAGQY